MKDYLIDVVRHLVPLGCFDNLRIDGTDTETKLFSMNKDRFAVVMIAPHAVIPEFKGTFGIPNLPLLNTILNIPEYQEDTAKTTINRNGNDPVDIMFENTAGDFKNEFRLIKANIIDGMQPSMQYNVPTWLTTFNPTPAEQQRLKYQSSAHPNEKHINFIIENGNIRGAIGDSSSHYGNFIFHSGVDKKARADILIPGIILNSILALDGDKTICMGTHAMMISIDSGLAIYNYVLPSQNK
jgi:hypothetical protein